MEFEYTRADKRHLYNTWFLEVKDTFSLEYGTVRFDSEEKLKDYIRNMHPDERVERMWYIDKDGIEYDVKRKWNTQSQDSH